MVPVSEHFPCGVKATYRKYSCDEGILIVAKPESPTGFEVCDLEVRDYPASTPHQPAGMYVLQSVPPIGVHMEPEPFVPGSRALLEEVVNKVDKRFGTSHPETLAEWEDFKDILAPQSDDANEYCRENGLNIPLKVSLLRYLNRLYINR